MLPCPICAASLKSDKLDKHLHKAHAGQRAEARVWSGSDRAIVRPLALLFVVLCASILLLAVLPSALGDVLLVVIALEATVFLLGLALALTNKLPATLTLEGDRLTVRYCFGLLRRSATLPLSSVEVGRLVEARRRVHTPVDYETATDDVAVGAFVRLRSPGGVLVLGAKKGTSMRKHWEGWHPSGPVRVWDITLERSALVALEYLLVQRGTLAPRAGQGT